MSEYTEVSGKYVYTSEDARQKAIEAIEEKGYTNDTIKLRTEKIDGKQKPIIKIQKHQYRNLARHVTDLFEPAEQYIHIAWTRAHGHLQIYTEEEHVNFDMDEWVENHPNLNPRPKYRDDPPEHLDFTQWENKAQAVFFSVDTYGEYTDLRL